MKLKAFCDKYIPIPCIVALALGAFSGIVLLAASLYQPFAEWTVTTVGAFFRLALAKLTTHLPFSLAELLLYTSPILLVLLILFAARIGSACGRIRLLCAILAVISLFYVVYVFTLGVGYHRTPLASRMELASVTVDRESLIATADILKRESEALASEIEFDESGSSVTELDIREVSSLIVDGYAALAEDMPSLGIEAFSSSAKPVLASKLLTKLELLGIYSFFTGESNVNVHYPDYTMPFTVAHEFAHQRGISRENEANFIAFLVCIRSSDPYVRYSGYVNMLEYVASALNRTDKEAGSSLYAALSAEVYGEMRAYSKFYYDNKSELLGTISEFVNDNYLKAQGTEGVVSYGLVVRLAVAYYSNGEG